MPRVDATADTTVLKCLQAGLPDFKRATLERYLAAGQVEVNGEVVRKASHRVRAGDVVEVGDKRPTGPALRDIPAGRGRGHLRILHLDDDVVVVDKPPGLLSTSEPPLEDQPSVVSLLREHLGRPHAPARVLPVHRLDRETSGVMVVARTPEARAALIDGWEQTEKTYTAVVEGQLEPATGTLVRYLAEDERTLDVRVVGEQEGRRTISHWRVLRVEGPRSLVEVDIETGHKHQIRVHLKELGCPVVGDPRYGGPGRAAVDVEAAPTASSERLGLHATRLAFVHPGRAERVVFEVPPPSSILGLLRPARVGRDRPARERSGRSGRPRRR